MHFTICALATTARANEFRILWTLIILASGELHIIDNNNFAQDCIFVDYLNDRKSFRIVKFNFIFGFFI